MGIFSRFDDQPVTADSLSEHGYLYIGTWEYYYLWSKQIYLGKGIREPLESVYLRVRKDIGTDIYICELSYYIRKTYEVRSINCGIINNFSELYDVESWAHVITTQIKNDAESGECNGIKYEYIRPEW